ncbi:MAG: helix-hairpin-helix domain-containing protein [Flavobacterium sp.]|nr:MAG: helix-hairpin-helix domain-containing protein [Flavobacterium sp.]
MRLSKSLRNITFTRSERNGLLIFATLIVFLQAAIYYIENLPPKVPPSDVQWLALQQKADSIKLVCATPLRKIYPFNPNFITDEKGYRLGLSVAEIDRLLAFRKLDKFVNSAEEFQQVTKVHDSVLQRLKPYFKFPDWVNKRNRKSAYAAVYTEKPKKERQLPLTDINVADAASLMKVYGIGPALSERIIKQRTTLGGFANIDQLNDIWGLSPEVVANAKKSFAVLSHPEFKKVDINSASLKELAQFPYFRYAIAKSIVTYRSMNGALRSADELAKIPQFPVDKVDIIAVYLDFKN